MEFSQPIIKRPRPFIGVFSVVLATLFVTNLPNASSTDLQFVDKTVEAGLSYPLTQSYGLSWGDFNNDNMIDLHIRNHGKPPSLYKNLGNGIFKDVTNEIDLDFYADFHGASWGDFDNDGDLDLYQALGADHGQGTKANFLYKNQDSVLFADIAGSAGVQDPKGRGRTPLWFDYDRDGNLDLFVANAQRVDASSVLFRNDGNDSFTNVTESAGVKALRSDVGAYVADINGDAVMDLIVSSPNGGISLYSNNGDGTFGRITEGSGLAQIRGVNDLALGDYDNDGDVDIFACRGASGASDSYVVENDSLYYRLMARDKVKGFDFEATNSSIVEFDLYVEHTRIPPSYVYIGAVRYHPDNVPLSLDAASTENHGEPTLTEPGIYIWFDMLDEYWHIRYLRDEVTAVYTLAGVISTPGSLGQVSPVNLEFDLKTYRNRLYKNSGRGYFTDVTNKAGLAQDFGNATSGVFSDFDNDGDLDLYVVYTGERGIFNEINKLYENNGEGRFSDVAASVGAQAFVEGRGQSVAVADYNNDGFMDLMILNGGGEAPFGWGERVLLENQTNSNNWIQIKAVGNTSNRDGVGCIVNLEAGPLRLTRQQTGGMHRISQNSQVLQFGLGKETIVDEILVHWPSGIGQRIVNVSSNQRLVVEEPEPTVSLSLFPDAFAVPRGGVLEVQVVATNHTNESQGFLLGTNVNLPNGDVHPPLPDLLFGPRWRRLAPYETKYWLLTHEIPRSAPTGKYIYNGAIGKQPWTRWNEDHFQFRITR
ncbi:MAG: CRTAC1 family protein [Candidatus Hodarchaeota archaeon]